MPIHDVKYNQLNMVSDIQQKANEENARIVKTNAGRNAVLIQTKNLKGENTHVSIDSSRVRPPEVFLGILHKHPVEALFSSEDILPMVARSLSRPRYILDRI